MSILTEKIYGFTRGIVIKNDDPSKRGRIKIFLPAYPALILNGSYSMNKPGKKIQPSDVATQYLKTEAAASNVRDVLGTSNIGGILPPTIMEEIASIVPWADQASPLMGSGGMGIYDASSGSYNVSDVSRTSADISPAKKEAKRIVNSVFPDTKTTGSIDVRSKLGVPSHTHNSARGSFSIPKVGSHVWVFFENGNVKRPIYFAYSFNDDEWNSALDGTPDAPSIHQPSSIPSESNSKSPKLIAGKYTLTERGGTIEIVNTQNFEAVKLTDFHGNTYQLTNHGIFENTATGKNKSSQISGDYFLKVDGNYKVEVTGDTQIISKGTKHHVSGDLNDVKLQERWLEKSEKVRKNAAKFKAVPDFSKLTKNISKTAEKNAPNDSFCLPKFLNFKLPFNIPHTVFLKQLNTLLFKLKDGLKMAITVIKDVKEMSDELLKILRNPFSFILSLLGDPIKLLGIKLCNDKKKE
jgi:hypothetical protein